MSFDLKKCSPHCVDCVKSYIKKHNLKKGDKFQINCTGIPKEYVTDVIAGNLNSDKNFITAMVDPVMWAATFLDWHCIDPEGIQWKRKTEDGSLDGSPPYDEKQAKLGKSPYNRPYQALLLRCTSAYKVFRLGRQVGKTEALVILALFNLFTKPKYAVEVIAPFSSQVDLIFSKMLEYIISNPTLNNSKSRSVKAPQYKIQLKNGSFVIGFTAGSRGGQDAGQSRGQHANFLIFDEADMLNIQDIEATLAVIINHPDAFVCMSSTPTGKREKFFTTCHDLEYREFYYPATINPLWNEKLEKYFRNQYTEMGYDHEIMAKFGEQEEGVFQQKYIEAAKSDYEYGSFKPNPQWSYFMGVDWNDIKNGTTIAIIGVDPLQSKFYLVAKEIISKEERTQLTACQKIAELNRLWNCTCTYVDRGFGSTQLEILHDYGARALKIYGPNHPDARLRDTVKGFDFGGNVEIHDLFTKQPVNKPAKPFLVENAVRRFESYQFFYPKSDEQFTKQLSGYIIDRISNTGRPIFKAQNEIVGDHFLDAVMLALVSFTLEKSHFAKPTYLPDIGFAGKFGESSKPPLIASMAASAEKHRPQKTRAITTNEDIPVFIGNGDMPVANIAAELQETKVWNWPGFLRDGPRPQVRQVDNIFSPIRNNGRMNTSRSKPQRKKF